MYGDRGEIGREGLGLGHTTCSLGMLAKPPV